MVAGLIGIWFVVAVVFYVLKAARAVLPCIPKALGVLLCLPAMPFAVAYKNRETHPWQARCIVIGWSLLYLLLAFILYNGKLEKVRIAGFFPPYVTTARLAESDPRTMPARPSVLSFARK